MYNGSKSSILVLLLMAACCHGQESNRSVFKLLESSAPLPGGGTVVSRFESEGTRTTTVTGDARLANSANTRDSQTQQTQQQQIELQRPAAQTQSSAQSPTGTRPTYAYPVPSSNARVARVPARSRPNALASYPAIRARRTAQSNDYVVPTLGISSPDSTAATATSIPQTTTIPRTTARVAENCCNPCAATQQSNLSVTGFSVPAYDPNAALTAPSLLIQPPVGSARGGGFNLQNPNIGVPQFNNTNRTWTPFASGAGAYQPLVRLVNMQPGTFLGQGVIGQPTAYVDGQPIRNLFRYLFPL